MRYIQSFIFLLVLSSIACKKNQDITETTPEVPPSVPVSTIDVEWSATVGEKNSLWNWSQDIGKIHNASVKLMYEGNILDETNTNGKGEFSFPLQPVPDTGAYFLFESSGYYNTVVKVDTGLSDIRRLIMLPNTFPNVNGEAISGGGPYVTLKGKLQDPTEAQFVWVYITNTNNELIGTALAQGDGPSFTITTLANEELFLHYHTTCHPEGMIPLGSFSQDTDLGILLDQSMDFSNPSGCLKLSNAYDCSGNEISEYNLYYKKDGTTYRRGGTDSFCESDCVLLAHPVTVTLTTQTPRKYQEKIVTYIPGPTMSFDMTVCEDDDTFLKYTIGNEAEVESDYFTYANIISDGRLVLKQYGADRSFAFVFSGSDIGSHTSKVVSYDLNNALWIDLGADEINSTITMNDGEFVEGTFSGEVLDADEISLGILEGSFRARIQ